MKAYKRLQQLPPASSVRFNGRFPCVPRLAGSLRFSSFACSRNVPLGDKWYRFLLSRCRSCLSVNHPCQSIEGNFKSCMKLNTSRSLGPARHCRRLVTSPLHHVSLHALSDTLVKQTSRLSVHTDQSVTRRTGTSHRRTQQFNRSFENELWKRELLSEPNKHAPHLCF